MSENEELKSPVPTVAKVTKDIEGIIKDYRIQIVVEITENGLNSRYLDALLDDIEHLKRIKEALK